MAFWLRPVFDGLWSPFICSQFTKLAHNVVVYGLLRGLARNLANKNRIENPRGFS
jgi:hypothetical protein